MAIMARKHSEPVVMRVYTARITGQPVAECPECKVIMPYWSEQDRDENGNLICYYGDPDEA